MVTPQQRQHELISAIRRGDCPDYAWMRRRFGVSNDTAKRDKQALLAMGAQLVFDPARRGFRLLNPEWEWPANAVAVAATEAGGVAGAAARALLEAWNPELSSQLSSDEGSQLDAALVFTTSRFCPPQVDSLCLLVRAIAAGKAVQLGCASPWEPRSAPPTIRLVSPWLLQVDDGHTYLRGYCHLRSKIRSFHLAGIHGLTETDQPARPRPTDLRPLVRGQVGVGGALGAPQTAVVRFRGAWARWVAREIWHPEQEDRWFGDELERRFPFGMVDEALRRLLPGGAEVEVVGPLALRDRWRETVGGMVERTVRLGPS